MLNIQLTVHEAQRLLVMLFEHPSPDNLELIQTLEAALDDAANDAAITEDYTIDE